MDSLKGKVAVVTGGASGIGFALAEAFSAEGMRVALADIEAPALSTAVAKLVAGGADVIGVVADVSDRASLDEFRDTTFDRFGTAHVVCNNAGVATGGLAWTITESQWRWIIGVNLMGVVHGINAFVPRLIEQGEGHVVNIASSAGLVTGTLIAPYCATKHAVVALSEGLANDLAGTASGVGCSVVCPEVVRTRIRDSDRNRPADVEADNPTDQYLARRTAINARFDAGLEPAAVASLVVDAVRSDRFYVFTDSATVDALRTRVAAIEAGRQPPPWFPAVART